MAVGSSGREYVTKGIDVSSRTRTIETTAELGGDAKKEKEDVARNMYEVVGRRAATGDVTEK